MIIWIHNFSIVPIIMGVYQENGRALRNKNRLCRNVWRDKLSIFNLSQRAPGSGVHSGFPWRFLGWSVTGSGVSEHLGLGWDIELESFGPEWVWSTTWNYQWHVRQKCCRRIINFDLSFNQTVLQKLTDCLHTLINIRSWINAKTNAPINVNPKGWRRGGGGDLTKK